MTNNYLPTVLASSVIRSTEHGESHGGLYLVDLETNCFQQVLDWNSQNISWKGRGGERGLRGIAFSQNHIYLVSHDKLFVYDKYFNQLDFFQNPYLNHCHEIFLHDNILYLTSTLFDSILLFDIETATFTQGYCIRYRGAHPPNGLIRLVRRFKNKLSILIKKSGISNRKKSEPYAIHLRPLLMQLRAAEVARLTVQTFNPNSNLGPALGDTLHLNNVFYENGAIYIGGTGINHLLSLKEGQLSSYARLPYGTHNARPYYGNVLINSTSLNCVSLLTREGDIIHSYSVEFYPESKLEMSHFPADFARQGFARGLCLTEDGILIGGSSPATISAYDLTKRKVLKTLNLTMDVRNAIHGLEIWPF